MGEKLIESLEKLKIDLCKPKTYLYRSHASINKTSKKRFSNYIIANKNKTINVLSLPKLNRAIKGAHLIGSGKEGKVYMGCTDGNCDSRVAVKVGNEPAEMKIEFMNTKRASRYSGSVVKPIAFKDCGDNRAMMMMQYCNGGTLAAWIKRHPTRITDGTMMNIIARVLFALRDLGKVGITHNDLHTDNIFMDTHKIEAGGNTFLSARNTSLRSDFNIKDIGVTPLLGDFGFAHSSKTPNPRVTSGEYAEDYGIRVDSDPAYDLYVFMSSLRYHLLPYRTKILPTMYFLDRVMGKPEMKQGRLLKQGTIPAYNPTEALSDPYFTPFHRIPFNLAVHMIGRTKISSTVPRMPVSRPMSKPKAIVPRVITVQCRMNKNGDLMINGKPCSSYTVNELKMIAEGIGIKTSRFKRSKPPLCDAIKQAKGCKRAPGVATATVPKRVAVITRAPNFVMAKKPVVFLNIRKGNGNNITARARAQPKPIARNIANNKNVNNMLNGLLNNITPNKPPTPKKSATPKKAPTPTKAATPTPKKAATPGVKTTLNSKDRMKIDNKLCSSLNRSNIDRILEKLGLNPKDYKNVKLACAAIRAITDPSVPQVKKTGTLKKGLARMKLVR